ncbi:MAG: hypothetical protein MK319_00360 [Pseudomonadales bacterium]|nr:hypothetical protein [Pseudomonadales bacterium]
MSLELVAPGSLSKPGPVGRLVRFLLGILCLYALWGLKNIASDFVENPIGLLPNLGLMILFALCIFNYFVNIGFSRDWYRYPLILSLIFLLAVATVGYLFTGDAGTEVLGVTVLLWLGYFYTHLGISFLLAAALATPGCEERAIPELVGKITHRESKEHLCPVSILSGIDQWEKRRSLETE